MAKRKRSSTKHQGVGELPFVRQFRRKPGRRVAFHQSHIIPWVLAGLASLLILGFTAFVFPQFNDFVIHASTALALFFMLFAFGLVANLRRRAALVALVATGALYGITAWTPIIGVKSVLVLAMLVAFFLFALAGFNVLFVIEELLFDIHRNLHVKGLLWNSIPTLVILGIIPLVYWILPTLGLRWPTLNIAMPAVFILLVVAWWVRWRVGSHAMKLVEEAHFLSIGTITGAGLADLIALLEQTEGILPSIVAYGALIITWVFVSYNTLQRAQYFLKGADTLPWMALLFAAGFAMLAHVQALYGTAGATGLAGISEIRVGYLVFGVWVGLLFFFVRGAYRFFRFVRDERRLGRKTRRLAGGFTWVMRSVIGVSEWLRRSGARFMDSLDRVVPGGRRPRI